MTEALNDYQKELQLCKDNQLTTHKIKLPFHYTILVKEFIRRTIREDKITKEELKDFIAKQVREMK